MIEKQEHSKKEAKAKTLITFTLIGLFLAFISLMIYMCNHSLEL